MFYRNISICRVHYFIMDNLDEIKLKNIQKLHEDAIGEEMDLPKVLSIPQCHAIKAILDGKDLLCVLPTGSGKTLCILMPGIIKAYNVSLCFLNV